MFLLIVYIFNSVLFSVFLYKFLVFSIKLITHLHDVSFNFFYPVSQMATPFLKTRTEWCHSLRSSERTTPPNRGPTSGEHRPSPSWPANPEPQRPFVMAIFEEKP